MVLTLNGSIAVGAGAFSGQASGAIRETTSFGFPLGPNNAIDAFTLSGAGLQGTCSGHWIVSPYLAADGLTELVPVPNQVVEASLSCTLQLGTAPAAQTGLSIVGVEVPPQPPQLPLGTYAGLFGPGPSSLSTPVPASIGTVDSSDFNCTHGYDLVGNIALGGQVFHGDASGTYGSCWGPPTPFALTGASPSGDLSATCVVTSSPVGVSATGTEWLACTGQVGTGPVGSTTLALLDPVATYRYCGCEAFGANDWTGVFLSI